MIVFNLEASSHYGSIIACRGIVPVGRVNDCEQRYSIQTTFTHIKKFHANLDISLGKESLCSSGVLTSANEGYLAILGRVFLKERKNTPLFEHLEEKRHGYGSREVHFFWTSSARVHSDSRRSSQKVADGRHSSPIRDRKIRATKKKFANALWHTCAKCAYEKLTFELSLDNDIKQPQDGPFGW